MRNLSLAAAMEAFVKKPELMDVNTVNRSKDDRSQEKPESTIPGRLDRVSQELTLYMAVDPILASLHKEYLDACALLDNLAAQGNSEYDAMSTVASDRVESAHSAFSARLIELRHDEKVTAMVRMKQHRLLLEEMEERKVRRRMLEEKAFLHNKDLMTRKDQEHKRRKDFTMELFFAYMMMSWAVHNQTRQELKYAFEDAFIGTVKKKKSGTA